MASILTKLAQQKTDLQLETMSKEAYRWLMKNANGLRNPSSMSRGIAREKSRQITKFVTGGLYYFYYDPKTKDTLDYYDVFPMVIPLKKESDGFIGMNLHYLPLNYRLNFMDQLMSYASYNDADEPMRLRITYNILSASKRFKAMQPCIKKYLYHHIESKIVAVQPNEWDVAVFLPVHQFKKATAKKVWTESVEQIRNQ